MISQKMIKLTEGNSAIRAMFEEGNRLAALYGRENVYDFSLGNPNFPAPQEVSDAIKDILNGTDPVTVHGYMSNSGFLSVRNSIAEDLNRRFGTGFTGDELIMTVGAAGGLNVILKTLLNPGDEVIAFAPYFVEYGNYVSNYDGILRIVNCDSVTFMPDAEALASAINEKTKAVIINTPNNPTGVIYSEHTLRELGSVLERKEREFGHPIYLISDEPYRELCYDGNTVPFVSKYYKNTIIGYSWSKSLSLPGERIGYVIVPREADDSDMIIKAATIANRVLGFVNAPSLMQLTVEKCIGLKADISGYDANRRLLYDGLTDCGFECVFPQGAFYLWMKTPGDDVEFCARAKEHNILVVPGSSFAWKGYVRIAYCVSNEMIKRALPHFKKLAEETLKR